MKTKFLLLALLMLLPLGVKAQNQERTYSVKLTDLPEGLTDQDMIVKMLIGDDDTYYSEYPMWYNPDMGAYVLDSESQIPQEITQAKVLVLANSMITSDTLDWEFDVQNQAQLKTVSLKSYRKVIFDIEQGWSFCEKVSQTEYAMGGFRISKNSDEYYGIWASVSAGQGVITEKPEEQIFSIYAEPGTYYWKGVMTRLSDNLKATTGVQVLTIPETGKATVKIDREQYALVCFEPKNAPVDIDGFALSVFQTDEADKHPGYELNSNNQSQVAVFLAMGQSYEWSCSLYSQEITFFANTGKLTVSQKDINVDIDYADYVKNTISFSGLDQYNHYNGYAYISLKNHDENSSVLELSKNISSADIYLPKGDFIISTHVDVTTENSCSVLPQEKEFSVDKEQAVVVDFSSYHWIRFTCMDQPFWGDIEQLDGDDDYYLSGFEMLLPDGKYCVSGTYDNAKLEQAFTVSGADAVVNMSYNPADYAELAIELSNTDVIPEEIGLDQFDFTLFQDGKEIDDLSLSIRNETSTSQRFKKGTYTYKAILRADGPNHFMVPVTGTLELTGTSVLKTFNMSDFCYVPLEVKNEKQELVPAVNILPDDNLDDAGYIMQPDCYMVALPGTYDLTFFAPMHHARTQDVTVSKQTEKVVVTLTSADVYPLMVYVDDVDRNTTVTVTVDGVGSYQILDDEFIGDFKPFMAVESGTYKLTVTAPGYETYTEMIEVSETSYSEEDECVYFEISLRKSGSSIESLEQGDKPVITVSQQRICVEVQKESRMAVYNMNGACFATTQGKQLQTETLQPGIYLVKVVSVAGVQVKKVIVSQ